MVRVLAGGKTQPGLSGVAPPQSAKRVQEMLRKTRRSPRRG